MDLLIAIGALVILAWGVVVFTRGGLVGGALLVLVAGCCFGHPFFNVPLGPVPLTADRVLLVVLVVQYALYRHWGWIESKPLAKSDYILAALLVVLATSTLSHDYEVRDARPLSQLVFYFLMPTVMYWVARGSRFSAQSVWWLLATLAAFGVYLALTAIAETHQAREFVFPQYIISSEFPLFLGRARGPLLNPAGNGILLGLSMSAALVSWPSAGRLGKLIVLASLPLFAYGIYSTLTRSAWMGAGLGALVVIALSLPRGWRAAVFTSTLAVATLAAAVGWESLIAFKRDRDVSAEDVAESVKLRPILAVVAWHMFLDQPILGCGFGQYPEASLPYFSDRSTDLVLEKARPFGQHNAVLALLTETGILGAGLFVALLTVWTHSAWRLWRSDSAPAWARRFGLLFLGVMGVYFPNAMFQDVSVIPMVNMVLFFLGGAVTGMASELVTATSAARLRLWLPEGQLVAAD